VYARSRALKDEASGKDRSSVIKEKNMPRITVFKVGDGTSVIGESDLDEEVVGEHVFLDGQGKVHVVAGTRGGAIKTWDVAAGVYKTFLQDESGGATSKPIVAVSVAEKTVASATIVAVLRENGVVHIWNFDTQQLVMQLGVGVKERIGMPGRNIIMLSPDGSRLFVRRGDIIATSMLHGL